MMCAMRLTSCGQIKRWTLHSQGNRALKLSINFCMIVLLFLTFCLFDCLLDSMVVYLSISHKTIRFSLTPCKVAIKLLSNCSANLHFILKFERMKHKARLVKFLTLGIIKTFKSLFSPATPFKKVMIMMTCYIYGGGEYIG